MSANIDWTEAGVIVAVVLGVPAFSIWIANLVTGYRKKRPGRQEVALFGREASGPYPAIPGVIKDQAADHRLLVGDPEHPEHPGVLRRLDLVEDRATVVEGRVTRLEKRRPSGANHG